MRVFLDTNVIVDYCAKRKDNYHNSHIILTLAEEGKIDAYMSSLTVLNALYVLRKEITKDGAKEMLRNLIKFCRITIVGPSEIKSAFDLDWTDFEDCVQYLSAKNANVDVIVTRNTKDYKETEIMVMTPENFLDEYYDELTD